MTNTQLINAAKRVGFLSLEQEQDLLARARNDDEKARSQVVLSHLPLVMSYAAKHQGYHSIDDLISCGTIGLLKAIDRYKPERSRGGRFATYAAWWIRAEIGEFMLAQKSLVRIGTTAAQKVAFFNLNRAKAALGIDSHNLTPQQVALLAAELGIPGEVVVEMSQRLLSDISLNAPLKNQDDSASDEHIDHLEDTSLVPADEQLIAAEEKTIDADTLRAALASLKPRQRYVIERRMLREPKATLELLSQELGVSRERVRQIEHVALERVKAHAAGSQKPKARCAKPSGKAVRQQRIAFVRTNMDSMPPREMAKALGVNAKTIGNYVRALRREKLPLAA